MLKMQIASYSIILSVVITRLIAAAYFFASIISDFAEYPSPTSLSCVHAWGTDPNRPFWFLLKFMRAPKRAVALYDVWIFATNATRICFSFWRSSFERRVKRKLLKILTPKIWMIIWVRNTAKKFRIYSSYFLLPRTVVFSSPVSRHAKFFSRG